MSKLLKRSIFHLFALNENDDKTRFLRFYVSQSLSSIRLAMMLGFTLYGLFGIVDLYIAKDGIATLWVIRFVIVMPMVAAVFILTYSAHFIRYSQLVLSAVAIIFSLGVIAIIFNCEEGNRFYYPGLILCMFGIHTTLRLKLELALIVSGIIIVVYTIATLITNDDLVLLASNDLFLIGAYALGIFSSSSNEKMFRKDFQQVEMILSEKETILREKEAVAHSHQQLLELDSLKSRLISIMSHDIRGPISNIKGILNIYDLGLISDLEFRQNARLLSDSVDGTILLLENLLSWSVLQIENQPIVRKSVRLHTIVSNVFRLLRPQSDKKLIELINLVNPEYEIFVEPTMIELVIRNLVTNSIKFTDCGKIEVDLICSDTVVEISVKDTGQGIPDEIAANLFDWSKKKSSLGTQLEKGSGIGLIICKDFVEKHDGYLSYKTRQGQGTLVRLNLPVQTQFHTVNHDLKKLKEREQFYASG